MVSQGPIVLGAPCIQDLLQGIEHEVRAHGAAHPPAHDAPGVHVDHEGHVQPALPGRDVGEVRDPQLVRPIRERAVRMVQEHRGEYPSLRAAIESIASNIGCVPQTLNEWVKRAEIDSGVREGVTTSEAQRVKELEREVKELRRVNEILKLASAFFAQAELDRRIKS